MGDHHNQTVEGPSQIRYCHYLEAVLYQVRHTAIPSRCGCGSTGWCAVLMRVWVWRKIVMQL
eukprot:3255804-Rhodomonas_salina.3